MQTTLETITPALALEYLKHNTKNRVLVERRSRELAAQMKDGAWKQAGDTISFDTTGALIDGQHRLYAVILSGVSISVLVIRGLDPDAFMVKDNGAKRSAGDVLTILGKPSGTRLAAAAKVFYGLCEGFPGSIVNKSYNRLTHPQVVEVVEAVPGLQDRIRLFHRKDFTAVRAGPCAVYSGIAEATFQADPESARIFWDGVIHGTGLAAGDPALTLRNKMLREKHSDMKPQHWQWAGWIIAAWNAHQAGTSLSRLLVRERRPQDIADWTPLDLSYVRPRDESLAA